MSSWPPSPCTYLRLCHRKIFRMENPSSPPHRPGNFWEKFLKFEINHILFMIECRDCPSKQAKNKSPIGTRGRLRNSVRIHITLTSRMVRDYEVTDSWICFPSPPLFGLKCWKIWRNVKEIWRNTQSAWSLQWTWGKHEPNQFYALCDTGVKKGAQVDTIYTDFQKAFNKINYRLDNCWDGKST